MINVSKKPQSIIISAVNFAPDHELCSQLAAKEVHYQFVGNFEEAIFTLSASDPGAFDFIIVGADYSWEQQIVFVSMLKEIGYKGILAVVLNQNITIVELTQLARHYLHFFVNLDDGAAVSKKVANLVGLYNIKEERNRLQRLEEEVKLESEKLVDANVNNVRLLADVNKKNKLLDLAKNDMQNLLDNLGQGFLLLNRDGRILDGYSAAVEKIFGINPHNKFFTELLGKKEVDAAKFQEWISMIFSEVLDFSDLVDLGPKYWQNQEKFIALEYRPIRNKELNVIEKVIVIATDKTVEKQLEEKHRQEENFAKMLQAVAKDRNGFKDFYQETHKLLDDLALIMQQDVFIDKIGLLFRIAHSVKGNASAYQLQNVKTMAHLLENYLGEIREQLGSGDKLEDPSKLKLMAKDLLDCFAISMGEVKESFGADLFMDHEEKRISVSLLLQFRSLLQKKLGNTSKEVTFLDNLVFLDDFAPYWERFQAKVQDMAQKMDKKIDYQVICPEKITVKIELYKGLLNACIHAFRNAIDHGIETADERISVGKDPVGRIQVTIRQENNVGLSITIADDGRGVDPEKVKSIAITKNFISFQEAAKLTVNESIALLLKPGFSTKSEVSEWSGRGVGLDALAFECYRIGGKISINSVVGQGTDIVLSLPFNKTNIGV